MHDKLNHLVSNSIATTTARTYQTAYHRFIQFCSSPNLIPYPASSLTLQYFVASLSLIDLKIQLHRSEMSFHDKECYGLVFVQPSMVFSGLLNVLLHCQTLYCKCNSLQRRYYHGNYSNNQSFENRPIEERDQSHNQ